MILFSEDEEEAVMLWVPIIEDPTPIAPAAQPISIAIEEEEDIAVPAEELDKFFFSPLVDLDSSSISKHLAAVHEYFSGTFL